MNNLPKISDPQKQEERSVNRIKLLIDDNKFLVRDERINDFGVDLRLELILDRNSITNITITAQLKSTNAAQLKDDHSLTFSKIDITNLHYLLNSPYSIYIIYLESHDLFFWDYCINIEGYCESRAIFIENTNQETVSYNFTKILNSTSIGEIHNELRYRYTDLLLIANSNLLLTEQNSNSSDLNISKNIGRSKQALNYYLDVVTKESRLGELMQLTLYNYEEICKAKTSGIVTSRLANGLMKTVGANLSVLIGETDLSEILDDKPIIFMSSFNDLKDIIETSITPNDIVNKIIHNGIQFSDSISFMDRINLSSRYEYIKQLQILGKLTPSEYNNLCFLNLNSRDGKSYKTITQLMDFRFNDNYIENEDASYYWRYFILDSRKSMIEIYEVNLKTFYLLLSEICSAKHDIEVGTCIGDAKKYLEHMNGIISELISIYNH